MVYSETEKEENIRTQKHEKNANGKKKFMEKTSNRYEINT